MSVREAVHDVVWQAWQLLDDTANSNPPEVSQDNWDSLSNAIGALDDLLPDGSPSCCSFLVTDQLCDKSELDALKAENERLRAVLLHISVMECFTPEGAESSHMVMKRLCMEAII